MTKKDVEMLIVEVGEMHAMTEPMPFRGVLLRCSDPDYEPSYGQPVVLLAADDPRLRAPAARHLTEAAMCSILELSRVTAASEAARDAQTASEAASDAWAERCQLEGVSCRVIVHRLHGESSWFVSCPFLGIEGRALASQDPEDSKTEAILFIRRRLARMTEELDTAAPDPRKKEAK